MKRGVIISMENGIIEAAELDGMEFLGKMEINPATFSNLMRHEQIDAFLGSIVLPMLSGYAREIEEEEIQKEEATAEA